MTQQAGGAADLRRYEIRLGGHLEARWAAWFDGVTLAATDDGSTALTGALDQAALHGLLRKVRDLGLPLLAVTQLDPSPPRTSTSPLHQPGKTTP